MWAIRRELHAFDCNHPPTAPALLAWRMLRALLGKGASAPGPENLLTALYFVMCFVDDLGAVTTDDLLYNTSGAPVHGVWRSDLGRYVLCPEGTRYASHLRRPDAHYSIALSTIEAMGHSAAVDKGVPPCLAMDLLGTHIDVLADRRQLTELKCTSYAAAVRAVLDSPSIHGGARRAPYASFNSTLHKLLHAASVVVLGRQHVYHLMAARNATNRMSEPVVLVHAAQVAELEWWLDQFAVPTRHCLPLASRLIFPYADEEALVIGYSDAARELAQPLTSGYGAWTVFDDTLYYVAGLWLPWELESLSINVLELAAENMGTFTFLRKAKELGRKVSHSLDFVDNTAAEYSADRGRPKQASMRALVKQRFDALDGMNIYSAVERITSIDNDWADALSRGEERVADVLRWAHAAKLRTHRLLISPEWRSLEHLRA